MADSPFAGLTLGPLPAMPAYPYYQTVHYPLQLATGVTNSLCLTGDACGCL